MHHLIRISLWGGPTTSPDVHATVDVTDLEWALSDGTEPPLWSQFEARYWDGTGVLISEPFYHRRTDGEWRLAQLALDALWKGRRHALVDDSGPSAAKTSEDGSLPRTVTDEEQE